MWTAYLIAYWTARLVSEHLLRMLGKPVDGTPTIAYSFDVPDPKHPETSVPAAGRCLQLHGSGRFIVICKNSAVDATFHWFFHAYVAQDLFLLLAGSPLVPGGADVMRVFEQRARTYMTWTWGVPIAMFLALWLTLHNGSQAAEVRAYGARSTLAPAAALFGGSCSTETSAPIVLVAASGGGTRAALYTASVLDGLAQAHHLDAVRIVSGISGGGAALAYFASHRSELVGAQADVWSRYFDLMGEPYIRDVLDGAGEWRIAGPYRLGTLLAESFGARWQLASRKTLGEIDAPGLILNSTIAGHFDRAKVRDEPDSRSATLETLEQEYRDRNSTELAPGRLIFTNMAMGDHFGTEGLGSNHEIRLPIIVVNQREVRLEAAAAANANFPPVFSDAAVDITSDVSVDDDRRVWVTDGGVLDNRAIETLLYTVARAFEKQEWIRCQTPPDIHVIVADASAFSNTFVQDRAIGTAIAAGSAFAGQLAVEVFNDLRTQYASHNGHLYFHYLPMPDLLRVSGAFGTHWMLQPRIRVLHDGRGVNVPGESIAHVLRAMHGDRSQTLTAQESEVLDWSLHEADIHGRLWNDILTALK